MALRIVPSPLAGSPALRAPEARLAPGVFSAQRLPGTVRLASLVWILDAGAWDDAGRWNDNEMWKDSA